MSRRRPASKLWGKASFEGRKRCVREIVLEVLFGAVWIVGKVVDGASDGGLQVVPLAGDALELALQFPKLGFSA